LFWNRATGAKHRPREVFRAEKVIYGVFSRDGGRLALNTGTTARIWDVAGEKELVPPGLFRGAVNSVCFSPDGALLAIGVESGVLIWDLAARSARRHFDGYIGSSHHRPLAFSPDGRTLALLMDSKVTLYEVATGREKVVVAEWSSSKRSGPKVGALAFTSDGQDIALSLDDGTLDVRDASTGRSIRFHQGMQWRAPFVAFSKDGRWLAAAGAGSATQLPADLKALFDQSKTIDRSYTRSRQAQSHKAVNLWDVATGKLVQTIPGVDGPLAFSPDGRTLATGPGDYSSAHVKVPLWLWDAVSVRLRRVLDCPRVGEVAAAFSPDGRTVATWGGGSNGDGDGTLRLWDAESGAPRRVIRLCHAGGAIKQIAFSPTGRYLATANANGTVYILRVQDL
jgi:WD40 repeat protein